MQLSTNVIDDKDIENEPPVLAVKQKSRTEKHQLPCSCQNCEDTTVNFEPPAIIKAKSEDVQMPSTANFALSKRKNAFLYQIKQLVGTAN